MKYIVLDLFDTDFVNVSCDEEGKTLYFETEEEAFEEAANVQNPLVIDLDKEIVAGGTPQTLLNIVIYPTNQEDAIPYGKENRLFLNGRYLCRFKENDKEYTITWDAYCDLIEGLKMAIPGVVFQTTMLDEAALTEMFGKELAELKVEGTLWDAISRRVGVQSV